ncbi:MULTISPECIES: subunit of meta cleavage enzyme [Sphingomonadaceae]|uniref:Subunit of meta cleavage enzyme n=1 Tax=Sphingomonas adhaesiva TaxID=28212 RepID=A0A2A4I4S3_9SPHN|nr:MULTISPECIES: subunit of meta cleavage enzyme [Sphingomonadaceae]PCG13098.1 subunit of meta cleavage enzyme [Sphingomonas adhaesiva]QSR20428.1 subunit of meta cleavage enzyme [Novosphingobium sp. KA1]BAE75865.1 subunit of meta cleavage enzyme [Novosphingobium sp. KA1]BAF03231.1 subunit of meta cleavage enzyme [Novosphingobium sp. KA1]
MTGVDSYRVNQLVQELFADPANLEAFANDREALYDRYGLSREQRAAIDAGGQEALTGAGLHPVLQMHHFMATNPAAPDFVSIKAYRGLVKGHG